MSDDAPRELSRLYRASAGEEPPARLDAELLRAAHEECAPAREVGARPPHGRWVGPMALAAVVILSASLVMSMYSENADNERAIVPETGAGAVLPYHAISPPDSAIGRPESKLLASPENERRLEAESTQGKEREAEKSFAANSAPISSDQRYRQDASAQHDQSAPARERLPSAPAAAAPAPAAAADAPSAKEPVREAPLNPTQGRADTLSKPSGTPEKQTAATEKRHAAMDTASDAVQDPEEWLRDILRLWRDGREHEARASLEEFRKLHPQHAVPEDLQ